jgi:ligand-binding sensor domain-containing protein/two-component sensor histidine kinase
MSPLVAMGFTVSRLQVVVGLGLLALGAAWPGVPGGVTVSAQRLPLRAYTSASGLAGDHISALLPDSRGFLWIGTTTGLSRFDGHEFRNYGTADGLPHPSITALLEDRDRVLWVGTRGGLVRIKPDGTSMEPVPVQGQAANIRRLLQTRDGRVWVALRQEVIVFADERRLDAPRKVVVNPPLPPSSPATASQDREWEIEAIAEGSQGDVWIGTRWGVMRRLRDGRMTHVAIRPAAEDDRIYHLAVDRDGRVWLTHWGLTHRPGVHFGLYVFMPAADDASDGALHARARSVAARDPLPLPRQPGDAIYITAGGPLGDARIHSVLPAPDGNVWIANEAGLIRVDQNGRVARYDDRNGLGMPIQWLARDAHGSFWLGSRTNGLVRFESGGFVTFNTREGFTSGEVGEIVEDGDGALCVSGTDPDGGHFFGIIEHAQDAGAAADASGERLTRFQPRGTERVKYWGWGWNQLFLRDRAGEWWVPTGEGLFRYPASPSCASIARTPPKAIYTRANGLPHDDVFRLFEDSHGDLWISAGSEAVRWRRATNTFERVPRPPDSSLRTNPPTGFAEDRAGQIWIGFYRGGVARWRGPAATGSPQMEMFGVKDGVPEGFIQTIVADSRGRIWIGGDPGGLARIDDPAADRPRFTRPAREEGLSEISVSNVIEDGAGNFYVASARGMSQFDATLTHVRRFTMADGLASHWVPSALVDRHGRLWFGTHRGLSRLTPQRETAPSAAPPIFIDSLRVDGVPHPLSQLGATAVGGLQAEVNSRRVEIGYGSPSLAPGGTPRYQVRLAGVDPDWGPATYDRSALYLNLAPGGYRFEARAVGRDGLVSTRPAVVTFTIPPPIWQRLWFQIAAGLIVIGAAWLAYRSRMNRVLALARVRARIATDLHDDLGARLSRISILAEVASRRVTTDAASAARLLDEVGDTARSLIETAADLTWAVDPRQDDLASLAARVRRFAADMLDAREIGWTFDAPDESSATVIRLSAEHRRHVLLVFQEAINNIVRHAHARRVSLVLRVTGQSLHVNIEDDGRGFASDDASVAGRGLANMAARARELGGELNITSGPAAGTRVQLAVPLR